MLFSRKSSPIGAGKVFISSDSGWWYWALVTAFFSNWTIISVSKRLQFLLTASSELRISYCLRKSSKWLMRSDSLENMSSTLISSSINSSFERFSSWFLVRTIIIYKDRWYKIKLRLYEFSVLNRKIGKARTMFTPPRVYRRWFCFIRVNSFVKV